MPKAIKQHQWLMVVKMKIIEKMLDISWIWTQEERFSIVRNYIDMSK